MKPDNNVILIDGSQGEGGGQVVRSSLALSMCTGKPVRIENVRAKRKKPGLLRQHLTAVRAAAQISAAHVTGDELRSNEVSFTPGPFSGGGGEYRFAIGTAGSTTLVLQTILPALLTADKPSTIVIEGGTHNSMAPPFGFLEDAFIPLINKMGPTVQAELERPGFFPAGGGKLRINITPCKRLMGFELLERGPLIEPDAKQAVAVIADVPEVVAERELKAVVKKTGWPASALKIERHDGHGPGNLLALTVRHENVTNVFTAFGEPGRSSEKVANHASKQCLDFLRADAPVDVHLADQLMVPMALAAARDGASSAFRTVGLSLHARTQLDVVQAFLGEGVLAAVEDETGGMRVTANAEKSVSSA